MPQTQSKIHKKQSKSLKDLIVSEITMSGPMDIGRYMTLCLCHPQYGYYMKQDPLGARGDFTTAPEISQMFGEMIGAWLADLWMQMGGVERITLLEYGPGRGTLMADILRVVSGVPGMSDALEVALMDASPALKDKQKDLLAEYLAEYKVQWVDSIDDLSGDHPLFVIGNEFLDALPVRQFVKGKEVWAERVVGYDTEDDALIFGSAQTGFDPAQIIPAHLQALPPGNIYEFSPARESFMDDISVHVKRRGGAALFVDYGELEQEAGNSLQAIQDHVVVDALSCSGDADLSANVDFAALIKCAQAVELNCATTSQSVFLQKLGIAQRAAMLADKAAPDQREAIESALRRLCDPDQMGSQFKVMGVWSDDAIQPAGF